MRKSYFLTFCLAFLLCANYAWPEVIFDDPATIHVGPGDCGGTEAFTGCGSHPNLIGNSGLVTLYQNSGGGLGNPLSPVLLILAVSNAADPNLFNTSSISSVTFQNPLGSTAVTGSANYGGAYGLSSAGFQGSMGPGTDIYSFLCAVGLQPPGCNGVNNSNNFVNLSGALQANNEPIPSAFGIYVFQLYGTFAEKGLISTQFSSPLPSGTFIVGYAQTSRQQGQNTRITIYTTPFTESGLVTVPEPGTLTLLFTGLVGAAGMLRRKRA